MFSFSVKPEASDLETLSIRELVEVPADLYQW